MVKIKSVKRLFLILVSLIFLASFTGKDTASNKTLVKINFYSTDDFVVYNITSTEYSKITEKEAMVKIKEIKKKLDKYDYEYTTNGMYLESDRKFLITNSANTLKPIIVDTTNKKGDIIKVDGEFVDFKELFDTKEEFDVLEELLGRAFFVMIFLIIVLVFLIFFNAIKNIE